MQLTQSFRWFGPADPTTLQHIRQTGAQSIVSALHHVPHGEVWKKEAIINHKKFIEDAGFIWQLVESLSVHESIKTRSGNYKRHIENYRESLRNLAACNVKVITYNFMPVTDWTRTSLNYKMPGGSLALYFNRVHFALFDVYILKRKNAESDYTDVILKEANRLFKTYSTHELDELSEVIRFGIPGEKKLSVDELREQVETYKLIGHNELRENLKYFLQQVVPVAEEEGLKLALHPDDPPFDLFGLPRIVSNAKDVAYVLSAVHSNANGFCFCTGSFGASASNNLVEMIRQVDERIHFIHLRNTKHDEDGNFFEANHLDGDTDMFTVVKELLQVQQKVNESIPFRPDHGHVMLDDVNKITNPGYSCIGRMKGLAELRGLMLGISRENGWL